MVAPKEKVFYSIQEFLRFREQIPVFQNYVMANLMYLCGLRIGEVRALIWDNSVDLVKEQIFVYRAVTTKTLSHHLEETTPKTKKSFRKIPIGGNLLEMLKRLRSESASSGTGDYVFPSPRYGRKAPISEMAVKRFLDDAAKAAGLPQIDKHELRHSFATSLSDMGVDSETIGSLLGHSSKSITEKIYIHPNEKKRIDAMASLDNLLKGEKKGMNPS